jgi:hypothetical protein
MDLFWNRGGECFGYLSRANRQLVAFFALSRINNLYCFNAAFGSSPAAPAKFFPLSHSPR